MSELRLWPGWVKPPVVPDGWQNLHLADVARTVAGGRLGLTKERHYKSSGVPAYSAAGQDGFVDVAEFENREAVILSSVGALCGKCYLAEGKWTTLANVQAILVSEKVSARFLYHRVNRDDYWPRSGSAQPFIKPSDISQCWLSGPPLPEQQKIAEILDTVDEAIRKTDQIIAKLKQVKQGLLHDLLTRGIDDNGELRDPERHPEQFKDSPLGRIPKSWDVERIAACVSAPITYGIVQAGPHVTDGIPYIRTGDMSGEALEVGSLLRTSVRIASSYARSRVEAGEIICAIRATVGKVLPVPAELDGANLTQGTARIAPHAAMNGTFMLWALRTQTMQRQFDLSVKGTTFQEITLKQLRELLLPVPGRDEQDRIASTMQSVVAREWSETEIRNKLVRAKAGLAEDLLTGKVRTTNLLEPTP